MVRVICPNCSNAYSPPREGAALCPKCGYAMPGTGAPAPSSSGPMFVRAGAPIPTMAPPGPETLAPQVQQRTTNGLCITSMILGIVAFPFMFFGFLLGPMALIFGIIGLNGAKKKGQNGGGMAITGIVLGTIVVALWLVAFVFLGRVFSPFV